MFITSTSLKSGFKVSKLTFVTPEMYINCIDDFQMFNFIYFSITFNGSKRLISIIFGYYNQILHGLHNVPGLKIFI